MQEEKLVHLKKQIVTFASLVENMVEKSIDGLIEKDKNKLMVVLQNDEPKANEFEIELDQECSGLIALFQPEAKQLRTILMALKMNNDLERIGDHAVNMAQSGLFLIERPILNSLDNIKKMSQDTIHMFKDSIDSFIKEDNELAKSVCQRDDIVDRMRDTIVEEFSQLMKNEPSLISYSLHVMRISYNLERIADLSTNICEDILYMVNGKVIKHHSDELKQA